MRLDQPTSVNEPGLAGLFYFCFWCNSRLLRVSHYLVRVLPVWVATFQSRLRASGAPA
jgi:hypothetical protein